MHPTQSLQVLFSWCAIWASAAVGQAAKPQLTFFGWSDQHVQANAEARHPEVVIEAMNALPGAKYSEGIGGAVDRPAFVFGAGQVGNCSEMPPVRWGC